MPCLEITMPRSDDATRERLAADLTRAVESAAGFPADIFGICFHEYAPRAAASGGRLCDGTEGRPYLHMLLYSPRLRRSVKERLVASLTRTFTECVGQPGWTPVIHVCEHPYDNVGVEGRLLSDAYEDLAKREFYYPLPRD